MLFKGGLFSLAVYGTNIDHRDAARWVEAIEDELFPWSVDIVVVDNCIDSELSAHIERVGRRLFRIPTRENDRSRRYRFRVWKTNTGDLLNRDRATRSGWPTAYDRFLSL